MMRRVTSALIVHETDPELTPLRRGMGAVFAGLMISVLVAAGFGIYGIFTGIGGDSWRADGMVIVEKETGASYLYQDGSLRPVLNLASARLLSGAPGEEVKRVSGEDLAGLPRTSTVGIAGAPESLPPADRMASVPWTMCSVLGEDAAGASVTSTTLLVGGESSGGTPLGSRGLLVRDDEDGASYLIWNNHRYRISGDSPDSVIRSLFGAQTESTDVGTALLNGLPAGQDIGPIPVPDRGAPSTVIEGFGVGDIVVHPAGGGDQHYLVHVDGLAPLTELQVRILSGQYSVTVQQISPSVANSAPVSDALAPADGEAAPPTAPPTLATMPGEQAALCAGTADASSDPEITLGGDTSALAAGVATTRKTGAGTKLADRVLVAGGSVAVVRALPADGGAGALNIVTDVGVRFPVPSAEVLQLLGYSVDAAVSMPAALVQRIPAGPTLSPEAARQAAPAVPQ